MKIKIGKADAHHRVNGAVSMTYHASRTYDNVPTKVATSLIEAGKATEIKVTPKGDK